MTTTRQDHRSPRAAPLPPEARRRAIIAAVLPLLAEHGAGATSRQLATAAGVSEGTIFKVFKDKDDLFAAALDEALDPAHVGTAIEKIDRGQPFEAQLVQAVEVIQQRVVHLWQLVSKLRIQGPRPPRPTPLSDSPELRALLAAAPTSLRIDADRAAIVLRGLTLSLSHPMLVAQALPATEIVDLFLHGTGSTS